MADRDAGQPAPQGHRPDAAAASKIRLPGPRCVSAWPCSGTTAGLLRPGVPGWLPRDTPHHRPSQQFDREGQIIAKVSAGKATGLQNQSVYPFQTEALH